MSVFTSPPARTAPSSVRTLAKQRIAPALPDPRQTTAFRYWLIQPIARKPPERQIRLCPPHEFAILHDSLEKAGQHLAQSCTISCSHDRSRMRSTHSRRWSSGTKSRNGDATNSSSCHRSFRDCIGSSPLQPDLFKYAAICQGLFHRLHCPPFPFFPQSPPPNASAHPSPPSPDSPWIRCPRATRGIINPERALFSRVKELADPNMAREGRCEFPSDLRPALPTKLSLLQCLLNIVA